MNVRGSLLTYGGTEWYLKRKPNPDKPGLNIDPPERFVVSLAQHRRLRRMSLCLFYENR